MNTEVCGKQGRSLENSPSCCPLVSCRVHSSRIRQELWSGIPMRLIIKPGKYNIYGPKKAFHTTKIFNIRLNVMKQIKVCVLPFVSECFSMGQIRRHH